MMTELIIHKLTAQELHAFTAAPSHAVLLVGSRGIGKGSLARQLAADIMNADVQEHPYVRFIGAGKEKSISIEKVRELEHFLSLKVPGDGWRVVIIEDAELLGVEAQNALLKTLEEPPKNTVLILTVSHEQALLPTIRSRLTALRVRKPEEAVVMQHFAPHFDELLIKRAYSIAGGLPGLMSAILNNDAEHPLLSAAATARQIAGSTTFERLAMVDGLSKDRTTCLGVLSVLQQMSRVALKSSPNTAVWQRLLSGCHQAIGELQVSGQPKLVLTNLMLNL